MMRRKTNSRITHSRKKQTNYFPPSRDYSIKIKKAKNKKIKRVWSCKKFKMKKTNIRKSPYRNRTNKKNLRKNPKIAMMNRKKMKRIEEKKLTKCNFRIFIRNLKFQRNCLIFNIIMIFYSNLICKKKQIKFKSTCKIMF